MQLLITRNVYYAGKTNDVTRCNFRYCEYTGNAIIEITEYLTMQNHHE